MHEQFILKAIALSKRAKGKTSPNPLVGAVIVKNGAVISTGYHKKAGLPHAEINAINNAKSSIKGASMYVNLEPCCHYGRTPPCADAIISAGIKEVYIGMADPNPLVSGAGIKKLREHGIKVVIGILEDKCRELNEIFLKYITQKTPFVILKSAATLDGRTATASGDSKWITGEKSRGFVHKLRSEVDAVLVGSGTLVCDNPHLTARPLKRGCTPPVRVILDRNLTVDENANVLKELDVARTILFCGGSANGKKIARLTSLGAKVIAVPEKDGALDLKEALNALYKEEITSLLVEGGAKVNYAFVNERLADKMYLFFAPKLLLSNMASPIFDEGELKKEVTKGCSKDLIKDSINVNIKRVLRFDEDIMVEYYFGIDR